MLKKIAINFFLVLGLLTAQFGLVSGLPGILPGINLIIASLIFTLALADFPAAAYLALGAGLIEDIYSFLPFGLHLGSLFLTLIAVNFLYKSFFTNRSLYSFAALTALANLAYLFTQKIIELIINYFSGAGIKADFSVNFWLEAASIVILNIILTAVIFYIVNYLSHRFKPVFLVRRK
ncbi:MAG: hypothetical protein WCW77_03495 [Patescibacteria group bacterium]|jgi:hypothetical protein